MFVLMFVYLLLKYTFIRTHSKLTFSLLDIIITVESFKYVEANFSGT